MGKTSWSRTTTTATTAACSTTASPGPRCASRLLWYELEAWRKPEVTTLSIQAATSGQLSNCKRPREQKHSTGKYCFTLPITRYFHDIYLGDCFPRSPWASPWWWWIRRSFARCQGRTGSQLLRQLIKTPEVAVRARPRSTLWFSKKARARSPSASPLSGAGIRPRVLWAFSSRQSCPRAKLLRTNVFKKVRDLAPKSITHTFGCL